MRLQSVLHTRLHVRFQVSFGPGAMVRWGDRRLKLVQFHYHAPSEHSVAGLRYAMEAHLVHQDMDNGKISPWHEQNMKRGGRFLPVVPHCRAHAWVTIGVGRKLRVRL